MRPLHTFVAYLLALTLASTSSVMAQTSTQRPAITGVAFLSVYETQPNAARHFYGDVLGFDRIPLSSAQKEPINLYPVNAQQWIETRETSSPPKSNDRLYAVGFTTRDAAQLQRYLASRGYPSEQSLQNGRFSVRDPEGNLIFFVQSGSQQFQRAGSFATPPVANSGLSPRAAAHRIIHVGFIVHDAAEENLFWRDVLGFRPYWHGGHIDDATDYISQQVPDGNDWLEYMLNSPSDAGLRQHGSSNHVSLGVAQIDTAVARLRANGCTEAACSKTQLGRDGKVQLNLFDPDETRAEFMEFVPRRDPCCSAYTASHPSETDVR